MCTNNSSEGQENECPFLNPKKYIYGDGERKRFEAYQKGLFEEKNIIEVWRGYNNDFFPFDFDAYSDVMEKFLPHNVEEFSNRCNMLRAPVILQEIFSCVRRNYGDGILFDFMEKAPICANQDGNGKWTWDVTSFAAPIMLDFLFSELLRDNPINKEPDEKQIENFVEKIGKALLNRDDGYFLVWSHVKYMLSSNVKNQEVTFLYVETIGQVCSDIVKNFYGKKDWLKALRPRGFKLRENRERFSQTGLLGVTGKPSMLLDILVQMQFYDEEKLGDYIPCFEDSILLEDEMFRAFSPRPLLCHRYIADIYLASEDPVESWKRTWDKMSAARHRVWFNRYDEFSISIERNVNFLLIVGIAMMEQLFSSDCDGDFGRGEKICETLLGIVIDTINRRGNKVSQLNTEILYYLVTYRFMFDKKGKDAVKASDKAVEFLLGNNWLPRRLLEMVSMLKANGFLPNLKAGNVSADNFYRKIKWAAEYAIEQKTSEYKLFALGDDLKRWVTNIYAQKT